jgi:prepilin peptidase CpaA
LAGREWAAASGRHFIVTLRSEQAVQTTLIVVAIGILAIIAFGDVRTRRIPNVLIGAIAILSLIRIILLHDAVAAGYTFVAGAAIFAGGFLLFWRDVLGGGDAKLLAAMTLLIGYHDLFGFLFLMSLCGGTLGLAILARDKLRPRLRRPSQSASTAFPTEATAGLARSTVPYGVAIAAAGIITLILETPFLK